MQAGSCDRLAVDGYGNGSQGEGVLVLLHGFLGDASVFGELSPRLARRFGRVLALDLPGHGRSAAVACGGNGVAGAAALVAEALRRHGVRSCVLVGYSLGGRVAAAVAASQTSPSTDALLVVSTNLESAPSELGDDHRQWCRRRTESDRRWAAALRRHLPSFLDEWYAQPLWGESLHTQENGELLRRWKRRLSAVGGGGGGGALADALLAFSPAHNPPATPPTAIPLLLVCGEEDERYAAAAHRAGGIVVAQCGHAVLLQRPQRLLDIVTSFVLRHRAAGQLLRLPLRARAEEAAAPARAHRLTVEVAELYAIPLHAPLIVGNRSVASVTHLRGALLRVSLRRCDAAGCGEGDGALVAEGVGDCAPLEGVHCERIDDVLAALPELRRQLQEAFLLDGGANVGCAQPSLCSSLCDVLSRVSPPSLRFAAEMALLRLLSGVCEAPLERLVAALLGRFDARPSATVAMCALSTRGAAAVAAGGARDGHAAAAGWRRAPMKLKVGAFDVDSDVQRAADTLTRHEEQILRVDANRAWTLPDALRFAGALRRRVGDAGMRRLEYVEEPLRDGAQLAEFSRRSGVRFALDESLSAAEGGDARWHSWTLEHGLAAYVAKPSVLGGAAALAAFAARGDARAPVVVSSAFESGLGLMYLALTASLLPPRYAHGLGTFAYFADPRRDDIASPPFVALVRTRVGGDSKAAAESLHVDVRGCLRALSPAQSGVDAGI